MQYNTITMCDYYLFCMDAVQSINDFEKDLALDLANESFADKARTVATNVGKFTEAYFLRFIDKVGQFLYYLNDIIQKIFLKVKLFFQKLLFKIAASHVNEFFKNFKGEKAVAPVEVTGNIYTLNGKPVEDEEPEETKSKLTKIADNSIENEDSITKKISKLQFIDTDALNELYELNSEIIEDAIAVAEADPIGGFKEFSYVKEHINPKDYLGDIYTIRGWKNAENLIKNKLSMKNITFGDLRAHFNIMYRYMTENKFKEYLSKGKRIIEACKNNINKIKAYPESKIRELIDNPDAGVSAGFYNIYHHRDNSLISAQIRQIRMDQIHHYQHLARQVTNGLMLSSSKMLSIMNFNTITILKYIHYAKKLQKIRKSQN